jgi:PIN domain nuclease of toxin-antitoxin system
LLLDTHALVWALSAPQQLPASLRQAIQAAENDVYASLASAWEIAIKTALGKLEFDLGAMERSLAATGIEPLGISLQHTARIAELPPHHGDPFDRMLVAQALCESMTLVSRDRALKRYGVRLLWERA